MKIIYNFTIFESINRKLCKKLVINPTIIETFLKNTEKMLGKKAGKSKNCIV